MKTSALAPLMLIALLAGCSGDAGNNASAAKPTEGTVAAPAGTKWEETVVATPDGGFMMGNPNAPVKLVEYGSFTCSHCGEFAEMGFPKLVENYVATGQVAFEFRSYIRDPFDVVAALTTACGGAGPSFLLTEQMFAQQKDWMGKLQQADQAKMAELAKMTPAQQFAEIAKITGFDTFALERGIPAEKLKACYADKASTDRLVAMRDKANTEIQLTGTPTFVINGKKVENAADWTALEPAIKAALGS